MIKCSNCGEDIREGTKSCPTCGEGLDDVSWVEVKRAIRTTRREWTLSREWALTNVVFAGTVIAGFGVLLFLATSGIFTWFNWDNFWAYFIAGLGLVFLTKAVINQVFKKTFFSMPILMAGITMLAVGAAGLFLYFSSYSGPLWPLMFVGAGLLVIALGIGGYLTIRRGR
jgi:hypothetical protein